MFKNYLKIWLRIIRSNKIHSIINFTGLTIGLTAVILIFLYVQFEFSYDKYHQKVDRIYRVATEFHGHNHWGNNFMASSRDPLGPAMFEEFPEVESFTRIKTSKDAKLIVEDKSFHEETIYYVDPEIFNIFDLQIIHGTNEGILSDPFSVVISEKMVKKYFGENDPIGQTINYLGDFDFKVSGVIKDMPRNSHFIMDIIFPLSGYIKMTGSTLNDWQRSSCYTYVLLSESTNPDLLESKLPQLVNKYDTTPQHGPPSRQSTLFLQPLSKIHLYSNCLHEFTPTNNIKNVYLFGSIALLILVIACFNYMNLTTASSIKRIKEVGIRKTLGAKKTQIMKQFLGESITVTFFSLILALNFIRIILPKFNSFIEREIEFSYLGNQEFILWIAVLTILVGLISGSYPALLVSALKPSKILGDGILTGRNKIYLRNMIVVLQFVISTFLIISTIAIKNQLQYVFTKDLGYTKEQIVTINLRGEESRMNLEILKSELRQNPNILNISSSTYLPNSIKDQTILNWVGRPENVYINCYVNFIDDDYLDIYDIEIIKGRNFSKEFPSDREGAFLINETAAKSLTWENPLDHELMHWSGTQGRIVGIIKDFNFHSLRQEIEPLYLYFEPKERNYFLSVKISGNNIPETIQFLEEKISAISPKYPFEYSFFDEVFESTYKEERRMESLFSVFALIGICISCLGLFGLVSYTTEKRTKEIGIRKILGASVLGIVFMLSKEFIRYVLYANIIAWPIAWYIMNRWLQNFAYRRNMGIWIFLSAGALAFITAFFTVGFQSMKAAKSNPVESLRYE